MALPPTQASSTSFPSLPNPQPTSTGSGSTSTSTKRRREDDLVERIPGQTPQSNANRSANGKGKGLTKGKGVKKEDGGQGKKDNDTDVYFQYYSSLQAQANMLADTVRTETYRRAIMGNSKISFEGRRVMDVGAGSGILSFMSAQAGAKQVISIEASSMAEKITALISSSESLTPNPNPHLSSSRINVIHGKVEDQLTQERIADALAAGGLGDEEEGVEEEEEGMDVDVDSEETESEEDSVGGNGGSKAKSRGKGKGKGKVDTIVSEPIGVLLFHERMVETFLLARDLYLKPGGALYPSSGKLWFAPFMDGGLFDETEAKATFFNQRVFGTDFGPILDLAREESFSQPIIGPIPPNTLLTAAEPSNEFDFYTLKRQDLKEFEVEVEWVTVKVGLIHGIASWFDFSFLPPVHIPSDPSPHNTALREAWAALPQAGVANPQQNLWSMYGMGVGPENLLDPGELPEAPEDGWGLELGTGPYSQRTHWQQARLLFPEPLAVNRNQRVKANIKFTVHEGRSYYIDIDMYIVPDRRHVNGNGHGSEVEMEVDERTRRKFRWNLAQQTLNYSYQGEDAGAGAAGGGMAWKNVSSAYA